MRQLVAWIVCSCVALRCGGELEPAPTIGTDGTAYNSVTSTSAWSALALWKMLDKSTNADITGFNGGTFDGRYVYLAPQGGGIVCRFDTTKQLSDAGAWETFDTKVSENPVNVSFAGAAFDGRYVYLAPYASVVFRYDTQAPFDATSSWTTFDVSGLGAHSFAGVVFDGRFLVFIPVGELAPISSVFVRYDTQAQFDAVTSWTAFEPASVNAGAVTFAQGAFDGRYVYADGQVLARYDTQAPFASASSWAFFDPTSIEGDARGSRGVAFDGRYLYMGRGPNGDTLRYDTQKPFTDASSWGVISLRSLVPATWERVAISAADFDGRYIYFDAQATHDTPITTESTFVLQCDTQAPFESAASCASFAATSALSSSLGGTYAQDFYTTVFDGRFMYFASDDFTTVARFDVKSPPSMPALPAFHGSFF